MDADPGIPLCWASLWVDLDNQTLSKRAVRAIPTLPKGLGGSSIHVPAKTAFNAITVQFRLDCIRARSVL